MRGGRGHGTWDTVWGFREKMRNLYGQHLNFQAKTRLPRRARCKTAAPPSSTRTTRPSFRRSVPSTSRRSKSTTRAATNSPLTSWTSWESNPAQGWCRPQLLSEISTTNEGSWGVIMIFKLKQSSPYFELTSVAFYYLMVRLEVL